MNLVKAMMKVLQVQAAKKTHPTGDPSFAVMQAFPNGIRDSDPFLMCDHFGPTVSKGKIADPDKFPVNWHPHRGMDILTYLVKGKGRHADSLGNRGEYDSPGMQWISVGSGIEHAEGGGDEKGMEQLGFQIWINTPAKNKMDDPRYGTEPPENIPNIYFSTSPSILGRLLAGKYENQEGPFKTVQDVLMMDYVLAASATHTHTVSQEHDQCLVYIYEGEGLINGQTEVRRHHIVQLDAANANARSFTLQATGEQGLSVLLFTGKRIKEPIAWQGPFVMNTDAEIQQTFQEYRSGRFPPKRVSWDYKRIASRPADFKEGEL